MTDAQLRATEAYQMGRDAHARGETEAALTLRLRGVVGYRPRAMLLGWRDADANT